jgi:biotin carboxyl carrier protein
MKKYKFKINGNDYDVQIENFEGNRAIVQVNGTNYEVEVDKSVKTVKTPKLVRSPHLSATETSASPPLTSPPAASKGTGQVKSPLPGVILKILVNTGDYVKAGQKVVVLEAMKMENSIESVKDGKVVSVNVKQGDSVMEGDVLMVIGD